MPDGSATSPSRTTRSATCCVAQGNLPDALAAYQASLAIRERLAKADPGNAGWQRDLSVSHDKIGDVLVDQGNLPAALAAYQASLAISERLAKADPGNAGWQRDLSVSHNKIGDVLLAQGNLPAALAAYQASLAISRTPRQGRPRKCRMAARPRDQQRAVARWTPNQGQTAEAGSVRARAGRRQGADQTQSGRRPVGCLGCTAVVRSPQARGRPKRSRSGVAISTRGRADCLDAKEGPTDPADGERTEKTFSGCVRRFPVSPLGWET